MIVDDQVLFASSLKVVIESYRHEGLSVVGIAHDGNECLQQLRVVKPDIILMDVRMPHLDGVETTKIVHQKYPGIRIMMLTTFDDDTYVQHALSNGATGYVLKNVEPTELVTCIKAVFNGTFLVSSAVGYRLIGNDELDVERGMKNERERKKIEYLKSRFQRLTRREAEVLLLVLQGLDNHQISQRLYIAEQTVKNYTSAIYKIIGVEDRLHALQMLGVGLESKLD